MASDPRDPLLKILENIAETNRLLARKLTGGDLDGEDKPPRFLIDAWNTYEGFREDMIKREKKVPATVKTIWKQTLANDVGGDTVKTITRVMDRYHLTKKTGTKDYWPPTTWPKKEPPARGTRSSKAALLVAGIGSVRTLLDYASDGKLDGAVSWCRVTTTLGQPAHLLSLHAVLPLVTHPTLLLHLR